MELSKKKVDELGLSAKNHIKSEDLAGFTSLGLQAFMSSSIGSIHMPDHILSVGSFAFAFCSNLHTVIMSKNLKGDLSRVFRCSMLRIDCECLRLIVTELDLDLALLGIDESCNIFTHEEFFQEREGGALMLNYVNKALLFKEMN